MLSLTGLWPATRRKTRLRRGGFGPTLPTMLKASQHDSRPYAGRPDAKPRASLRRRQFHVLLLASGMGLVLSACQTQYPRGTPLALEIRREAFPPVLKVTVTNRAAESLKLWETWNSWG